MYHNTNNLDGSLLGAARLKTEIQEKKVLDTFKKSSESLTADQVWEISGLRQNGVPLTSVRRAMSNLSRKCMYCGKYISKLEDIEDNHDHEPVLIKTKEWATSIYGAKAYKWKLNTSA
jgi:predicted nucleic acid binding AN1-type Zn finger protein